MQQLGLTAAEPGGSWCTPGTRTMLRAVRYGAERQLRAALSPRPLVDPARGLQGASRPGGKPQAQQLAGPVPGGYLLVPDLSILAVRAVLALKGLSPTQDAACIRDVALCVAVGMHAAYGAPGSVVLPKHALVTVTAARGLLEDAGLCSALTAATAMDAHLQAAFSRWISQSTQQATDDALPVGSTHSISVSGGISSTSVPV